MANASYDWAPPRTAHAFTGYLQDGPNKPAGLVVRLAMHTPIPCTAADWQESGQKRIMGTILGFPKLGFANAPYSKKPAKASKYNPPPAAAKPLPLLEAVSTSGGEVTAVRIFNFNKGATTFDKGERDESSISILAIGQSVTFLLNEFLYEKAGVFPEGASGVIPAYSVVEMQLNPSHNQPTTPGYSMKIARVRRMGHSLYSHMACGGALERIQKTPEAALELAREQAKLCEPICNLVEQARYGFYAQVDPAARVVDIREDLEFVRIECPPGSGTTPVQGVQCVDVAHEDLMHFANAPGDLLAARTLVDLAIAAGAVKVFCSFDDYYNRQEPVLSQFRGVPLVDCASFLEPVKEGELETEEEAVTFPAPWKVPHDPQLQAVAFRVATAPKEQEDGEMNQEDRKYYVPPPCPDMPLMSPCCTFAKGYRVLVGNPGSGDQDADDAYYVLEAYFNAGRACGGGGGLSGSGAAGGVTGYKRVKI